MPILVGLVHYTVEAVSRSFQELLPLLHSLEGGGVEWSGGKEKWMWKNGEGKKMHSGITMTVLSMSSGFETGNPIFFGGSKIWLSYPKNSFSFLPG